MEWPSVKFCFIVVSSQISVHLVKRMYSYSKAHAWNKFGIWLEIMANESKECNARLYKKNLGASWLLSFYTWSPAPTLKSRWLDWRPQVKRWSRRDQIESHWRPHRSQHRPLECEVALNKLSKLSRN